MSCRRGTAALTAGMAAVLAAAVLVAGCGVPTDTDVRVEGPPLDAGRAGLGGQADPPPGPDDARTAEELVNFFLQAAANDPETVMDDLREFVHSEQRDAWQPDSQIYVVRQREGERVTTPGDPVRVDLKVRRVGALNNDGVVEPQVRQEEDLSFFVTTERTSVDDEEIPAGPERFRLVDPPAAVLLDDGALEDHFQQRPIYFWDNEGEKLVPDLRWLPRALPEVQRQQTMVDWLIGGPALWLSGSLTRLPDGLERVGNLVSDGGGLEVRLTAAHEEVDLRRLEAQLWWTLRPDLTTFDEVTLVVDGDERQLRDGYRSSNAAPVEAPTSFVVLEGEIWQYAPAAPAVSLPALGELDGGIQRAAVSGDGRHRAVVRAEPTGELGLALAGMRQVTETELVAQSMSRPVWLNNPSGTGLVVADGALHQFTSGETAVAAVELPDLQGPVTAVAAAPDGRRLALVAGDRLWVASVVRAGDVVSVSRHQQLPTTATSLDGVAFIQEDRLAVVGTAHGQSRLFELTVDGALERELPNGGLGTPPEISNFVAYPGDPTDPDRRGAIMFEAGSLTWRYIYPQESVRITAADLLGAEPDPDDEVAEPRAPFFQD